MGELVALARGQPGRLNYSAGSTPFQVVAERFKQQNAISVNHIPYKGSAAAVAAVIANDAQMTFVDSPPVVAHIKSGRLRGLAVTSRARAAVLPELPTMAQAGMPDFEVVLWTSLFAPAATPPAVIERLHQQIAKVLQMADVRERIASFGIDPGTAGPAELGAILKADLARWTAVSRSANIRAN